MRDFKVGDEILYEVALESQNMPRWNFHLDQGASGCFKKAKVSADNFGLRSGECLITCGDGLGWVIPQPSNLDHKHLWSLPGFFKLAVEEPEVSIRYPSKVRKLHLE